MPRQKFKADMVRTEIVRCVWMAASLVQDDATGMRATSSFIKKFKRLVNFLNFRKNINRSLPA
jgi:hypothetical protein